MRWMFVLGFMGFGKFFVLNYGYYSHSMKKYAFFLCENPV